MKRLVVCCDGTWQRLESPFPTNVERIAQAVKSQASDDTAQVIYYHEGIGTWDEIDKLLGGAFGIGIDQHIQLAYLFLALNYDPGDEVYLFGFSRGAYTVRGLAGMLNRCELVTEQNIRQIPAAYQLYRLPRDLTAQQQKENARYQPVTLVKGLQDQADFRQLNPLKSGQSKSFVVDSAKLWNPSGIALERGRVYDVNVEADQTWKDWYIPTDADGDTRETLRPFEFLRRVPDQNWLKLIGTIGRDEKSPIIIGSAVTNFSPSKSGELLCFANDIAWMYWNNCGSVRVTVTRMQ
jgi:Uncharacterized alpha/beta hydrolase domain (DUF2235)